MNTTTPPKVKSKLYLAMTAALSSSIAMASPLYAQEESGNDEIEVIEIKGNYRKNLQNALLLKRDADSIVDGISAETMGSFPDLNLGESLQRIVGVQINRGRSDSPRDASINLRGLPSNFSRTLINGLPFADPVDYDGTSFGVFKSEMFAGLEVVKSPTANLPEGGLSGVINLKTAKPLNLEDGAMAINLKGVYEELTETTSPSIAFSTNNHFLDDKLGVTFSFISSKDHYRRDSTFTTRYTELPDGEGGTVTMDDGGKVFYPSQMRQLSSSFDGDNLSLSTAVQYKLNDDTETNLTVLYADRDLDRPYDLWVVSNDSTSQVEALSTPLFAGNNSDGEPEYIVTDVNITNIDTTQGPRPGTMKDDMLNVNWDLIWSKDDWRVEGGLAYSEGTNITSQVQYDYRYGGENGLIANVSTGGANWQDYSLNVTNAQNAAFADINALENTSGDYFINGNYVLQAPAAIGGYNRLIIAGTDSEIKSEMNVAKFKVEHLLDIGALSSFEVGALYTSGSDKSVRQRHTVLGIQNPNDVSSDLINDVHYLGGANFMGGNVSTLNNWLSLDASLIEQRFQPIIAPTGYEVGTAGWALNPYDRNARNGNYTADTDILSVYGKLLFEDEIGDMTYRGNVGVRYVDTSIKLLSIRDDQGAIEQVSTKNDYDNLLPSANISLDLTDDLVLRGAYSKTIVRPLHRDNTPAQTISISTDPADANPIKVTLGNTELEPYSANSYDLSLEWYNRPGSAITLALFKKDIDGFIHSTTVCPNDGAGLPFGTLTGTAVTDSSGVVDCFTSDGEGLVITQEVNSSDTLQVNGIEISVQQNLDFLPGFWSGFGGYLNYTLIDISGEINGTEAALTNVAEKNYNAVAFYETDIFSVRLAYNWRGEMTLPSGGTFSGAARSVADRGQLDASATYNITDKLMLSLEAFNLSEAPHEEYEGTRNRSRRADYDGRTFIVGLNYTF